MIKIGKLNQYKLVKYVNNSYIISWGLTNCGNNIYKWNYKQLNLKPSIQQIKKVINEYYNNIIKNNIENNFKWNGMNIHLSLEKQINYKLLYDNTVILNGSNLPEKVKFKINNENIYYSFETIEDLQDFIVEMNNHIRKYLLMGYKIKESINYDEYEECLETI